ncbi:MAG: energy transducer TonB [Gammaproteobacteria bacterium]|nr:energy transducer TonB [Gammaproteobacteria bacterium]
MLAIYSPCEISRFLSSLCLSFVVTLGLFLLMHQLIAVQVPELVSTIARVAPVIQEPPPDMEVQSNPPLQKPVDAEPPPEWQPRLSTIEASEQVLLTFVNKDAVLDRQQISHSGGVGIVVIFRVAPDYPLRAVTRGIEGFVDLVFDITPAGQTTNIRVIDAQPQGIFEEAAIRALKKWKYKPPMEDGVPYGQDNMTARLTFEIEDA